MRSQPLITSWKHRNSWKPDYYRYWDALLKDERLIRYIEENDLQIIFYPHREMHRFLKYFHVDHPKITVASWPEYDVQTLLKESAVLVTDFSSVAMGLCLHEKATGLLPV